MLTADQFVGRDDGLLQQRGQDSHATAAKPGGFQQP